MPSVCSTIIVACLFGCFLTCEGLGEGRDELHVFLNSEPEASQSTAGEVWEGAMRTGSGEKIPAKLGVS